MNSRQKVVLCGVASVLAAAVFAGLGGGPAHASASFPCRWKWDLEAGLRAGYVTAASSADCRGHSGSLTLSVRLLRLNPKTKKWHTAKVQTRTWRDLNGNRYVGLSERCTTSTVRAVFNWTLRDTSGAVVSRNSVKSGTLKVPGPDCKIGIR